MDNDYVKRLMRLWTEPLPPDEAALAAFRQLYTDPVLVNGAPLGAAQLLERAKLQQRAFSDMAVEIIEQVQTADKLVVGFLQRGRHTGPLSTPLGDVPPSGQHIERQVIDILTLRGGKIAEIRVVGDELGLLLRLHALKLAE